MILWISAIIFLLILIAGSTFIIYMAISPETFKQLGKEHAGDHGSAARQFGPD